MGAVYFKAKALLLFAAAALSAFADTIVFTGPTGTIIGDPLQYNIFDVKLTQPTAINPRWVLTIDTNYGTTIGGNPVIPSEQYGDVGVFSFGDFLISWNGGLYGVAMTAHDGYTAGDLYQVPGFQTSGDIMGFFSPRP